MKATHKGECQACGSTQKLPRGVLSNHGYTVKWGFFSGTCQGSKHLPYEQSCELIETFISRTQALQRGLKNEIEELRNYKGNLGWHKAYDGKTSTYTWKQLEISQEMINNNQFIDQHNRKCFFTSYSYRTTSVQDVIRQMNETRIYYYLQQIKEMDKYIEWQNQRVKDWKLMPLSEV